MYQTVRYSEQMENLLAQLAATEPQEAGHLIDDWQGMGVSDSQIYLVLALASARWIDYHGPWIGHGTLNMAPLLHASNRLLDDSSKRLALLQATVYVLELFRNPNYGPYLQPELKGVQRDTAEQTLSDFYDAVFRGDYVNYAQNLFVGLYRQTNGDVRWPLLRIGVQNFGRNEHLLLIVQRTLDLLDIDDNWQYGESLLRPAVQYNSNDQTAKESWNRVQAAIKKHDLLDDSPTFTGIVDAKQVKKLVESLLAAENGAEADFLAGQLAQGVNLPTLYEAVALASGAQIVSARNIEQHGSTGIHCLLDIVRNDAAPADLRVAALLSAFESARTRTAKSVRADWHPLPVAVADPSSVSDLQQALARVATAMLEDPSGQTAIQATADYLASGGDEDALATMFMRMALETEGPFDAIHTVKMIWRAWQETVRSTHEWRWLHLASTAFVIAVEYPNGVQAAKRVLVQR